MLVLGVTYKRDIDDVRESPALDILSILERRGARVGYKIPTSPSCSWNGTVLTLRRTCCPPCAPPTWW